MCVIVFVLPYLFCLLWLISGLWLQPKKEMLQFLVIYFCSTGIILEMSEGDGARRNTGFFLFATAIFVVFHSNFGVPLQTHARTEALASHSSFSSAPTFHFTPEPRSSFAAHLHYSFLHIYSFFFFAGLPYTLFSLLFLCQCVCVWGSCDNWRRGRRVIERGGSRSAVCVRVQQRRSEWGGGWGRGRQRHLWSGPTNLIFHVSPSRSLSPRTQLSHKNVYFVSPYFCF